MSEQAANNGHNPAEGQGVLLQALAPSAGQTSDTRLCERAIRERWPLSPEVRQAVIARLKAVLDDKSVSTRETVAACRAMVAADQVNIASERLEVAREAAAKPVPVSNNVTIVESDDWYGTRDALREKAQQYGLTESRLVAMIENNGDHASVQDRIQGAIAADPDYAEFLRAKACGTLPKPSTPNPN